MWPYWILFLTCAFGTFAYAPSRTQQRRGARPLLLAMLLAIALMVGFRMEVGGDWYIYLGHFGFYRSVDFTEVPAGGLDIGFGLINWLVAWAGLSPVWINVFAASVFCWGLGKFLQNEPHPWLALVVAVPYLIIVVAMGYTRQSIAIGFLLAAIVDFQKHNSLIRLGMYLAAGALFHKTVVIMFPIIALAQKRHILLKLMMVALMAVILYYAFAASEAENLYMNYVVSDYDAAGAAIRLFMGAVPAFIFLLFKRRFGFSGAGEAMWRNLAVGSLMLFLAFPMFESSVFLDRSGLYFLPVQLMVYNRLPFTIGSGSYKGSAALVVVAGYATVLGVWLTTATHAAYWLPYEVYLSTSEQEARIEAEVSEMR